MVAPPLNLYSQNDNVPFIGPCHLPKFWDKKPKATTKVTNEPPMRQHEIQFNGLSHNDTAI